MFEHVIAILNEERNKLMKKPLFKDAVKIIHEVEGAIYYLGRLQDEENGEQWRAEAQREDKKES